MLKLNIMIILFVVSFNTPLYSQDTIRLNELNVREDFRKKPKVKTIGYGEKKSLHGPDYFLFYKENRPVLYLVEDLPYGIIQEITLNFSTISESMTEWREHEKDKPHIANTTEYALTLYEADGSEIGKKINQLPIKILVEGGTKFKRQIKTDLSKLNYKTSKFFIYLKKITATTCYECSYYAPVTYKTDIPVAYLSKISNSNNDIELTDTVYALGLFMKIKTLTRQY